MMINYIKRKWLFFLIVLILLLLNTWVWFVYEPGMEIKSADDFMIATISINNLEIAEP